jgi:hypothetical protein
MPMQIPHASLDAQPTFVPCVDLRCRIISDQQGGKPRRFVKQSDLPSDLLPQFGGGGLTVRR